MSGPSSWCEVSECPHPAFRGSLCQLHVKRLQRGAPLSAPIHEHLDPKQKLLAAALKYADADSEDDAEYLRRERLLVYAARILWRSEQASPAPGVATA
jgi:hypothetical protein